MIAAWRCLCGTVNQRAAHICSDCGVRRPDWYEGEDCDHEPDVSE